MESTVGRGSSVALWKRDAPVCPPDTLQLLQWLQQDSAEQMLLVLARMEGLERKLQRALARENLSESMVPLETRRYAPDLLLLPELLENSSDTCYGFARCCDGTSNHQIVRACSNRLCWRRDAPLVSSLLPCEANAWGDN